MNLSSNEHAPQESMVTVKDFGYSKSAKIIEMSDTPRDCVKSIYDHLYEQSNACKNKSLKKLLLEGFDSEQIFQQLELQNQSVFKHLNSHVSSLNMVREDEFQNSDDDSCSKEYAYDDSSEEESSLIPKPSADINYSTGSGEEETISNGEEEPPSNDEENVPDFKEKLQQKPVKKYSSIVDDQFFKLSEMEEFLRLEDLKAEKEMEEDFDSDDEIDYFKGSDSDDIENNNLPQKGLMYEDFFDPPDSGDEIISKEDSIAQENELSETENDEVVNNSFSTDEKNLESSLSLKTPFELEQEKVKKTILDFEEKLVQKAEWHLTGEAAASSRPKDSLLQKETDFDVNAKPVIIEDSVLCEKTEQAIISIIKNKSYSDGQRRVKPTDDIASFKKELVLDQNKSKKSLAQVYEDDYLKKKYGKEEQKNPKHSEVKKMMDSLLPELQALFCHIPREAVPEVEIISNLPAITVEEVAPTSISDAMLLAPEEVKKKSGLVKGQSERDDTDRKRERRKKKLYQKYNSNKLASETLNPNSAKAKRLEKLNSLKKVKQHKNTKLFEVDQDKIRSSKDFFSKLQDSLDSEHQSKKQRRK